MLVNVSNGTISSTVLPTYKCCKTHWTFPVDCVLKGHWETSGMQSKLAQTVLLWSKEKVTYLQQGIRLSTWTWTRSGKSNIGFRQDTTWRSDVATATSVQPVEAPEPGTLPYALVNHGSVEQYGHRHSRILPSEWPRKHISKQLWTNTLSGRVPIPFPVLTMLEALSLQSDVRAIQWLRLSLL
jgi:hypothetical protein